MTDIPTPTGFVWQFPAVVNDWWDGDTCYVHRAERPGVVVHGEHVRVQGINAPELHDAGGAASKAYAEQLAPGGTQVLLLCTKQDKYGRLLARITLPDGTDFSDAMIAAGQAVAYLT